MNVLISDVSYVLLFPKDPSYSGSLNKLYKKNKEKDNFSFFDYFKVNTELLEIYEKYSSRMKFHIFTSDVIQNDPALKPYLSKLFDGIYSASEMNTHKTKPEAYKLLINEVSAEPNQILYIDDDDQNISAARPSNLKAVKYISNSQIKKLLQQLF